MIQKSAEDNTKKVLHVMDHNEDYIELVHSGEDYFYRLEKTIEKAQEEIHLQTYIFENDSTGNRIATLLKEAAKRKVKVYVLLDAYGCAALPDSYAHDLVQHGISLRFFSPLFSWNNFYLGRRMHHKVVVADGKTALIGGINIADKYHGTTESEPWLDYAVQLYCPAAEDLQKLCRDYFFKQSSSKKIKPVLHLVEKARVGILQNDWLKSKTEVCDAYTNAILHAEKEIVIVGSYFLPGSIIAKALKKACKRGIKTTVILAGISDVPLVRRATEHLYSSFLNHHMRIYEWNKSVVHGKASVVDKKWSTVGSFNLNSLSCYGSIEMNVEIHSVEFAENLRADFEKVISECSEITKESLKQRAGIFNRLANWVSYQMVRTAMLLLTFLPHLRFLKDYRL
ncbi:phospholipase D-like domain-containing protein [Maribacter sp. PR1]|uniref:Phospholipase D-like domain-containing protein n=1 Tax=Maribacter cobaltidurans TaxID=1178778 RepID=A0ABU7IU31_9FLAO|nr:MULTISPECIES: phospholipase D-like domain-containing protein [Maribacter]MDC6388960.1 phospholipase D-like domain-containing protein [Maribacter sp. PR1]MEE1976348.1 phospholipase D-like domain-containing protein [Maribacter cobaltidurans]